MNNVDDKIYAQISHICGRNLYYPYKPGRDDDILFNPAYCPVCIIKFYPKKILSIVTIDQPSSVVAKENMRRF